MEKEIIEACKTLAKYEGYDVTDNLTTMQTTHLTTLFANDLDLLFQIIDDLGQLDTIKFFKALDGSKQCLIGSLGVGQAKKLPEAVCLACADYIRKTQ